MLYLTYIKACKLPGRVEITHNDAIDSILLFNKCTAEKAQFWGSNQIHSCLFCFIVFFKCLSFLQTSKVVSSSGIAKRLIVAIYTIIIR